MTLQDKATIVNDDIKTSFGGDTPLVDIVTNQADPLVNLTTSLLAGQIKVEDQLDFLNSGLFPSDIEGNDLTLVAQLMSTDRLIDQPSKAPIIVMGQAGSVLPAGTVLVDYQGVEWRTTLDTVIQDCYGYTNACSPVGRFDLKNGELSLQSAVTNIDKATNAAAPSLGGAFETDANLRNRLLSRRPQWQNKGTESALISDLELLTGVFDAKVITDLPDCFNKTCIASEISGTYTGTSYSVSTETISPKGVTWDGSNFWVVGFDTGLIYKYDSLGIYTGISFSVSAQDIWPRGITWDGADLWVVGDNTDSVYKYNALGVYSGTSFSVAGQDSEPRGIAWDGADLWVVGNLTDSVYKYDSLGVYSGISFSVAGQDSEPRGITWDGLNLWVVGNSTNSIYKYDALSYEGTSFSVATEDSKPRGITWDGSSFWVVGDNTNFIYKYATEIIEVSSKINNYMIAVLGGTPSEIGDTIFENLCFGTDRLVGDTSVSVRCDDIKFQPMCPAIIEVNYWLKCDCQAPEGAAGLDQLIADRLNDIGLRQNIFSSTDLCKVSKDLLKAEFRIIPKSIKPDCADCDIIFDDPITGEVDQEYCSSDLNTHCYTGFCPAEFNDCVTLQKWWYPVFLVNYITEQTGCPCPTPSDGCGCD